MEQYHGLEAVSKFLGEAGSFFVATEDGDQAKTRPFSFQMLRDGKLYFVTGKHKDVYQQMLKNPKVEVCAFKGQDIIRIWGKAVFVDSEELFAECVKVLPLLAQIYNDQTGFKPAVFYLEDPKAEYSNLVDYTKKYPIGL
ncbi:MAG: pyridoxamine 5'-phosphate oxidase family protein [Lachnospiraceae bacterium]